MGCKTGPIRVNGEREEKKEEDEGRKDELWMDGWMDGHTHSQGNKRGGCKAIHHHHQQQGLCLYPWLCDTYQEEEGQRGAGLLAWGFSGNSNNNRKVDRRISLLSAFPVSLGLWGILLSGCSPLSQSLSLSVRPSHPTSCQIPHQVPPVVYSLLGAGKDLKEKESQFSGRKKSNGN